MAGRDHGGGYKGKRRRVGLGAGGLLRQGSSLRLWDLGIPLAPREGSRSPEEGPQETRWSVGHRRGLSASPAPAQRHLRETGESWQRPAEGRGCASTRWSQLLSSDKICSGMPYVGGAALLEPRYCTSGLVG